MYGKINDCFSEFYWKCTIDCLAFNIITSLNNDIWVGQGEKLGHGRAGPSVWRAESRVGKWPLDRALIPPSLSPSNKIRMFLLWLYSICSLPPHPLPSAVFSELTHWTPLLVSHYLEFPPNHSRCLPLRCTVHMSLLSTVSSSFCCHDSLLQ